MHIIRLSINHQATKPLLAPTWNRRIAHRRTMVVSSAQEGLLPADENWDNFWSRYSNPKPSSVAGWVGKFVSFSPSGVGEDDIRFQDVWLRTFQERDSDGKFKMRMIRRADQAAKSWPRAGRERADGNDETVLDGTKADSCFANGFWHPYGRGAAVPPTRVVSFSPSKLAQVTLKLPDAQQIATAQAFDFLGGSEATFIHNDLLRWTLTVTYKGEGGGSIMFHQTGWDPMFMPDIDPEQPVDLSATLSTQASGPQLPADPSGWLSGGPVTGTSHSLRYLKDEETWQRLPAESAAWTPPSPTDEQVLFRYPGGAYGLYPRALTWRAELVFEAGVLLEPGLLVRYIARYGENRWMDTVSWQAFRVGG